MDIRRVVTGHRDGKAVFTSDEEVEPVTVELMPGAEFHRLWGGDEAPHFPDDGSQPAWTSYFPPVGGFRFGVFSLPPSHDPTDTEIDFSRALAEVDQKLPGMVGYMEPDAPGMHTTDTIDFEVVLEGTVVLELDDGETRTLHPGDTVVQNGTRHRWSNAGDTIARLAVFICGAHHDGVERPT